MLIQILCDPHVQHPTPRAGSAIVIPNPAAERERQFKAGREWYAQMMLASLVLEARPSRTNTPHTPSARGHALIQAMDQLAFGARRSARRPTRLLLGVSARWASRD
jgi:hypothetical protein